MKTKVLMVCLGNICRSPLAEGILNSKINSDLVLVDSAGTAGYHIGELPDRRSIAIAAKFGLDISHQRSRKLHANDLREFDYIYAMDQSNYDHIMALAQNETQAAKVRLLLADLKLATKEVPDPYYGGTDGFEKVYHMIAAACTAIAEKLNSV